MGEQPPESDVVVDAILGGRLNLRQRRLGHRAGTDAMLLAAAASDHAGRFVDLGAGTGAVGLAVATRMPSAQGTLVEVDPITADLARQNVTANGFVDRLTVACLDIFDKRACAEAGLVGAASLLLTNPPFFERGTTRVSPEKARAHVLDAHSHGDWLRRACALLDPHGRLVLIHRPDAVPALLQACEGRLGSLVLRAVHGRADTSAVRVLLAGNRGSRGPLVIRPPLVLHEADGRFTPEAEAVHAGQGHSLPP